MNLPNRLTKIDKEIEKLKPAIGAIILPRYQEICITKQEFGQKNPCSSRMKMIFMSGINERTKISGMLGFTVRGFAEAFSKGTPAPCVQLQTMWGYATSESSRT
jgi:hypothetical protein